MQADLTKSYVYGIDGRGRKALDMFGLGQAMLDEGVVWREMMAVPPQGPAKVSKLFVTNPDHQMAFMPRSKFLELLMGAVEAAGPAIKVGQGTVCSESNQIEIARVRCRCCCGHQQWSRGCPHQSNMLT